MSVTLRCSGASWFGLKIASELLNKILMDACYSEHRFSEFSTDSLGCFYLKQTIISEVNTKDLQIHKNSYCELGPGAKEQTNLK